MRILVEGWQGTATDPATATREDVHMTSPLLKERVADHLAQLARLSDSLGILGLLELDVRLQELRELSGAELRHEAPCPSVLEEAGRLPVQLADLHRAPRPGDPR